MRRFVIVMVCVAATAVLACATVRFAYPVRYHVPSSCEGVEAAVKAVTFNVAIAPGLNQNSALRVGAVADAMSKLDYDVLCLQEAWPYPAAQEIIQSLGLPPENVVYADTRGMKETGEDVCDSDQLDGLLSCVKKECKDIPAEDTALCAREHCKGSLLWIVMFDKKCFNCLAATVGKSADDVVQICTHEGASRVFGGGSGAILASRWPLRNREAVLLPSSAANRTALFATVEVPGGETIELACAHLSSDESQPPTERRFSNWYEEKLTQLTIVSERLRQRQGTRPALYLGDMNFGRPVEEENIEGRYSDLWEDSVKMGFGDPAADARPALCSSCSENSFRKGQGSWLIDHVLLRDPPGGIEIQPVCVNQILTQQVTIQGWKGESVRTHLSDHFGIRVDFKIR
jgi:endonuclease/exonuclease/phosphatase family metal-dependent hydrolase